MENYIILLFSSYAFLGEDMIKKKQKLDLSKKVFAHMKRINIKKSGFLFMIAILISFLFGTLFLSLLSLESREVIKESLDAFFLATVQNDLDIPSGLRNSLMNSVGINLFIWILGISIIGIPIILFITCFKSFTIGFSLSSILYFYGFRGIILGLIYILPSIVNIFIFIITSYFAIFFSIQLFSYLFLKKEKPLKTMTKKYIKILAISTILFTLSSLFEIFILPILLRAVINA